MNDLPYTVTEVAYGREPLVLATFHFLPDAIGYADRKAKYSIGQLEFVVRTTVNDNIMYKVRA